jgi:hypothetical protein
MTSKGQRYATVSVVLVAAALFFVVGWWSRQSSLGVHMSKEALFLQMEDGAIECALRPSFMVSLFGEHWREQAIYVSYKGWESSNSTSIVESEFSPMTSLCLNYAWRAPIPPKGKRWDAEVELYSRTAKKIFKLSVGMKSNSIKILHESVLDNAREILRPNGTLALRPLSGPGSEIP